MFLARRFLLLCIIVATAVSALVIATNYLTILDGTFWFNRPTFAAILASDDVTVTRLPCRSETSASRELIAANKTTKWILMYTTLFGRYWGEGVRTIEKSLAYLHCDIDNCRVTYDRSLFSQASAVVFHARDMPSADHLHDITRSRRPLWQRWAYHVSESPIDTPSARELGGLFNLTMTYELDSDIFMPYRRFRRLKPEESRPEKASNYAVAKTKMAAWLVSNCGVEYRNDVVKQLESLGVEVGVGGLCRSAWPHQLQCSGRNCEGLAAYRFYLAFENAFCKDYVTDKYWYHPFQYNMIPVVIGGADYNNPCLTIPGSYINSQSFQDVSELASYLLQVASNDALFNSYFTWRQTYYLYPDTAAESWPHAANFLCELCRIVHDEEYPKKSYRSISALRSASRDCWEVPRVWKENNHFVSDS